jgi:hypothetical protein
VNLQSLFKWAKDDARPVMIAPFIKDCEDGRKADLVTAQCRNCAEQLSAHLFVWRKVYPSMTMVKSWDASQKKFLGMDIALFQDFIESHFSVRTSDQREWRLDRLIAVRIWAECIASDSPLPEASWAIEAQRRQVV